MGASLRLAEFLDFLGTLRTREWQSPRLDAHLAAYQLEDEDLRPFTHYRDETYGRNLIAKTEHYELLLLAWGAKHRTPIHDHAGSRCWMWLQKGSLTFRNYAPLDAQTPGLKPVGNAETFNAPRAVYIDDTIGVHTISNCSAEKAVSLHLYSPPIPRCQIYNESTKAFEWIELSYYTEPVRPAVAALQAVR